MNSMMNNSDEPLTSDQAERQKYRGRITDYITDVNDVMNTLISGAIGQFKTLSDGGFEAELAQRVVVGMLVHTQHHCLDMIPAPCFCEDHDKNEKGGKDEKTAKDSSDAETIEIDGRSVQVIRASAEDMPPELARLFGIIAKSEQENGGQL